MFTLIIPNLLQPEAEHLPEFDTPALNTLMRLGEFAFDPLSLTDLYAHYLCGSFALPENSVYATPLWQKVGMNSMSINTVSLSDTEAESLCDGLNAYFGNDAYFSPIRPDLWMLDLPQHVQWQAPPLFDVLGRIDEHMGAQGDGRKQWLSLQTELQMWLHNHPMNRHRAEKNLPPINSIWLWNAPKTASVIHPAALMGTNSLWAEQSPLTVHKAPYNLAQWQAICHEKHISIAETALFLNDLIYVTTNEDWWAYHDMIQHWEEQFFVPILTLLRQKQLGSVRIITNGVNGGILTVQPPTFWAFLKSQRHFNGKNL